MVAGFSGGKKCLFLKTEDLAIKPEDRRISILDWEDLSLSLLCVINREDSSL